MSDKMPYYAIDKVAATISLDAKARVKWENRAAALANQPNNADECGRHLNKALAVIELKAHVARWGQEGYPPPCHAE